MKLYAKLKNNRGGQKATGDDTRIIVELNYKNTIIGELSLYAIIDEEMEGYRVLWQDNENIPKRTIKKVELPKGKI